MKIKEVEVFNVDELSDDARKFAYEKWLETFEYFWHDENSNALEGFADHFGIEKLDYCYGGSGDFISFSIANEEIRDLSYIRLWKYLKNNGFEIVKIHDKPNEYTNNPLRTTIYDSCPFSGYCMDETLLDEIRMFLNKPYDIAYRDLIQLCLNAFISDCTEDYEHRYSEESFIENCEANGYEFLEDGKLF